MKMINMKKTFIGIFAVLLVANISSAAIDLKVIPDNGGVLQMVEFAIRSEGPDQAQGLAQRERSTPQRRQRIVVAKLGKVTA